ncbi:uncharacterized protein LOC127078803 [Lathyrus oleraceus]|uniref:uncharacterized protein LOC127078803 n=1 Tax=Pisum sativum TaxID=3888 RepID=UPI0021D1D4F7|nr:uncharacterized protein LOC127078803 [Pisum sativum]
MGQISQQLASNSQALGTLPSGTVTNLWEHNNVNVVVTRSGKSTEENSMEEDGLLEVDLEIKETKDQDEEVVLLFVKEKEKVPKPVIKHPYPPRQKKKDQHEKKIESAILQGMKIPMKKKDRGLVIIPCTIGDRKFKKTLIYLRSSVSFIPLSIYKKLGIGIVQDTRMTLQFANRSIRRPYGKVEDVLVKIDKFIFPVDFFILEMPEDEEIPLILGRPFLETGRCMIDIEEETMTLKVYDKELKIDVQNMMQYKDDIGTSYTVEIIDQVQNTPEENFDRKATTSQNVKVTEATQPEPESA